MSRVIKTILNQSNVRYFSEYKKLNKKIKLVLYTKSNCSLCEKAKEELNVYYPEIFVLEEVDITKSKELFRKFKFDIPVFYYNGNFLMQHKIDRKKLDDLINNNQS